MQRSESLVLECDRAVRTSRGLDSRLGLQLAWQAYRRAQAEGAPEGILLALNAVAICQSGNGAHINALSTAIDAYRLARSIGERKGAAHALLTLAATSHDLYESPTAESMRILHRCIEEAVELGDISLELRAHNVLGVHLGRIDRFAEGLAEFEHAMAMVPRSDGTTPPSLLAGNEAHFFVRMAAAAGGAGREAAFAEAHRRIDVALAMARDDGTIANELRAHYNRGLLWYHEGEWEKAIGSYRTALDFANRLQNRSRIADINLGIGDALTALGRHEAAAAAYEAAYSVADDIRPAAQLHVACERLANACERAGRATEAADARSRAASERRLYDREREHARRAFERILGET